MPTSIERAKEITEYSKANGDDATCQKYSLSLSTLDRYKRISNAKAKIVKDDKKMGEFNWREWVPHLQERQKLHEKASWSQDSASITIETTFPCIVFKPIADNHLGDIGCEYDRFLDFTDNLVSIPYLYTALLGDDTDNFVSFKSQLAMLQQIMTPEEQDEFLESWLNEISHKVIFASHGNHSEFEEKVSARNSVKKLLNRNVVYFNGIGVCNLQINQQQYRIVATHKTRYNSSFNKTHGLKQLARKDIPDADIYLSGHIHDPSMEWSFERGLYQLFMVLGTIKNNDGFGKRYFSYFSARKDGAIVLDSTIHRVIPFPCLEDALEYAEMKNAEK